MAAEQIPLKNGFQIVFGKLAQARVGVDSEVIAASDWEQLQTLRPLMFPYSTPGGADPDRYGDGITVTLLENVSPSLALYARSIPRVDEVGRSYFATHCILFNTKTQNVDRLLKNCLAWLLLDNRIPAPTNKYTQLETLPLFQTEVDSPTRERRLQIAAKILDSIAPRLLYECVATLYVGQSVPICFVDYDPQLIPEICIALSFALPPGKRLRLSFMTTYTLGARNTVNICFSKGGAIPPDAIIANCRLDRLGGNPQGIEQYAEIIEEFANRYSASKNSEDLFNFVKIIDPAVIPDSRDSQLMPVVPSEPTPDPYNFPGSLPEPTPEAASSESNPSRFGLFDPEDSKRTPDAFPYEFSNIPDHDTSDGDAGSLISGKDLDNVATDRTGRTIELADIKTLKSAYKNLDISNDKELAKFLWHWQKSDDFDDDTLWNCVFNPEYKTPQNDHIKAIPDDYIEAISEKVLVNVLAKRKINIRNGIEVFVLFDRLFEYLFGPHGSENTDGYVKLMSDIFLDHESIEPASVGNKFPERFTLIWFTIILHDQDRRRGTDEEFQAHAEQLLRNYWKPVKNGDNRKSFFSNIDDGFVNKFRSDISKMSAGRVFFIGMERKLKEQLPWLKNKFKEIANEKFGSTE
jgi:hypothetical protein